MRALALLGLAGGLLMAFCQWLIYVYAPVEQSMGVVQKIFYFHLPVAWWCFASFFLSCISGILWLKTRRRKWDILSAAAVEVGMVCATLALITGSIWRGTPGDVVDMGPAPDHNSGAVVHLCRIPGSAFHAAALRRPCFHVRGGGCRRLPRRASGFSFRPAVAFHPPGSLCGQGRRAGTANGRCGHCLGTLFRPALDRADRAAIPSDPSGKTSG